METINAKASGKQKRALHLHGLLLPVWSVRVLSGILFVGAIGMPWIATWAGALGVEEGSAGLGEAKAVQLRPELVELPGGLFRMGSPAGEAGRGTDEEQHPAEVGAFFIGRTEVTLGQWEAVMGTRPNDCDYGCENEHPVQRVSWEDALGFMNKLTELENKTLPAGKKWTLCYKKEEGKWIWDRKCTGYRLPTEAEWEYAARAGTETAYSFGEDAKELCKYGNGASTACEDGYGKLAPVAKFKENPWGLYDMHGNVREWVWDWYAPYPKTAEAGYAGPETVANELRVRRGGSFVDGPRGLRSSVRDWNGPSYRFGYVGFRCVRGAPQP